MKWSIIAVFIVALTPAQSYPQAFTFDGSDLNEQALLRRAPPKEHADRSPSPPRRSQSPSDQATSNPSSSQAPERTHSPSQVLSHSGDSDSSTDGGRSIPRARVRARVTGPANVHYAADHHNIRTAEVTAGKRRRFTVRGQRRAAIGVGIPYGGPPGKVEMIVRGRQRADVSVNGLYGGSGSITGLAPLREAPEAVPAGQWNAKTNRARTDSLERQKIKAEIEGPGKISGAAFNPADSAAQQETGSGQ